MPNQPPLATSGNRYILVGLLLILLPLFLVLYHNYRMDSGTIIRLPVRVTASNTTKLGTNFRLKTPLNTIDTNTVTGHNVFTAGSQVFVFLSPGPKDIWYAYSLSKLPPEHGCQITSCLVLKGRVHGVYKNIVDIRYQYENFVASDKTAQNLKDPSPKTSELVLSIGADGRATLNALTHNGKNVAQPKIPMPELFGFTHITASAAPAR